MLYLGFHSVQCQEWVNTTNQDSPFVALINLLPICFHNYLLIAVSFVVTNYLGCQPSLRTHSAHIST